MKRSPALLSIPMNIIQKDIQPILSLCVNWKQEYLRVIQPYLIRHIKDHKFQLLKDGCDEPVFETEYLDNGRHTYVYHSPEVRVLCRKSGDRMIVTSIKYEAKAEE